MAALLLYVKIVITIVQKERQIAILAYNERLIRRKEGGMFKYENNI
jgi:hypothetical protein